MTVKELKLALANLPENFDDLNVILQGDPEGNDYHQCQGIGGMVVDDTEAYRPEPLCEEDSDVEYNCLVIYP